jgi:hypothetical protein
MEGFNPERNPYSPDWFKARALRGLHKLDEHSWDYSDSLLLYLPGSDERYETVQETDTPYHKLVTAPERSYLQKIAPTIGDELPSGVEYLDLGPGTEHKEQFLFDAFKSQGKSFVYRPVDISKRYLRLATDYAAQQGIPVSGLQSSFEELPTKLVGNGKRFVSLGLTYSNYAPSEVLPLLKSMAGEGGTVFINAQIRERTDMQALMDIYKGVAHSMTEAKMHLLGLDMERDISSTEVTDEIKVWHGIKNLSPVLEECGAKTGDRILAFQSLRPSLETLESDISRFSGNYKLLDTGESFVGAILK